MPAAGRTGMTLAFGAFPKCCGASGAGGFHQKGPHPEGHGRSQPGASPHRVTSGLPPPTVAAGPTAPTWLQPPPARLGGQNQLAKHSQSLKSHWERGWGGHVTAVRVAAGEGPPPCPRPRDPPVGVEEDVDEHGGDGGQRVGGHGQDAEAGLGALHGVQRGAGGWQGGRATRQEWGQLGDSTAVPPRGHRSHGPPSLGVHRGGPGGSPQDAGAGASRREAGGPGGRGTRYRSPGLGLRKPLLTSSQVTGTHSPLSSL